MAYSVQAVMRVVATRYGWVIGPTARRDLENKIIALGSHPKADDVVKTIEAKINDYGHFPSSDERRDLKKIIEKL